MKEIVIEIIKEGIKILIMLGCFYFLVNTFMDNKTDEIKKSLNTIKLNNDSTNSVLLKIDSLKNERPVIINNIDKRTIITNNLKQELKTPMIKDTNIIEAINFLHEQGK